MICTTLVPGAPWPRSTTPIPTPPRRKKQPNGLLKQRISAHIKCCGPCSTAQIKLETGIWGGQVSHYIAQLREDGLIRKTCVGAHPRNGQQFFMLEWIGEKQ